MKASLLAKMKIFIMLPLATVFIFNDISRVEALSTIYKNSIVWGVDRPGGDYTNFFLTKLTPRCVLSVVSCKKVAGHGPTLSRVSRGQKQGVG